MGMCVQKTVPFFNIFLILAPVFALFCACDAMDNIVPSTGSYKVNVLINGISIDECSFIAPHDKIQPYFEESVSNDRDVTALMVYLRNQDGDITGWKVIYEINKNIKNTEDDEDNEDAENGVNGVYAEEIASDESSEDEESEETAETESEENIEVVKVPVNYKNGDEMVIPVKNLDDELPFFPIPKNIPVGKYTLVSQAMGGKVILQRTEINFYYLGDTGFVYDGINVSLSGIADSNQIIPRGSVILLETVLDFDSSLDPYIVWYSGRRRVSEGKFSEGAGQLFWKAPELSGFFTLRAEVFPIDDYEGLAGYQKEISLLVSSKAIDINLISEIIPQLLHWYVFDGDVGDLKPAAKNSPKWMSANGTYGLAAGYKNVFMLPIVKISDSEPGVWQTLFRFKPVNDGGLFSIVFDSSDDISLNLYIEENNLILTLKSPQESVTNKYILPNTESFITAGVSFSILPEMLLAKVNVIGDSVQDSEQISASIGLEAEIKENFQILLGFEQKEILLIEDKTEKNVDDVDYVKPLFTAIWNEFAVYNKPPMEVIVEEIKQKVVEEEQIETSGEQVSADINLEFNGIPE